MQRNSSFYRKIVALCSALPFPSTCVQSTWVRCMFMFFMLTFLQCNAYRLILCTLLFVCIICCSSIKYLIFRCIIHNLRFLFTCNVWIAHAQSEPRAWLWEIFFISFFVINIFVQKVRHILIYWRLSDNIWLIFAKYKNFTWIPKN